MEAQTFGLGHGDTAIFLYMEINIPTYSVSFIHSNSVYEAENSYTSEASDFTHQTAQLKRLNTEIEVPVQVIQKRKLQWHMWKHYVDGLRNPCAHLSALILDHYISQ